MPPDRRRTSHGLVAALLALTACSGGRADPRRLEPVAETSTTTSATSTTTTSAAPPVTKPLTTAPPSPLLTEVVAAYDAAYQDLLAAGAVRDPDFPRLDDHIGGAQLDRSRELLAELVRRGVSVRENGERWRRVESIEQVNKSQVDLTVCRFDPDETLDPAGVVVDRSTRSFRYLEQFDFIDGGWRWVARAWLDEGPYSDCAWPSG